MDNSPPAWQSCATREVLQVRAQLLASIRQFFAQRQVLEVETPILSHAGTTDPNIESFCTQYFPPGASRAQGQTCYLATSPEFHMKRLLACGSGAIYQISRVFRNQEQGSHHNPEFSLLEWYRPGFDLQSLMLEVAELVQQLVRPQLNIETAVEYFTYQEIFQRTLAIDPLRDSNRTLMDCAQGNGIELKGVGPEERDVWLDVLMSHCVQPLLGKHDGQPCLTFIYHYPASQAALAQVTDTEPRVAERFELFIAGHELANGYHELRDAEEQRKRFQSDLQTRRERQLAPVVMDELLIDALHAGLPDCSGVALGIDRLLQVMRGVEELETCLAFPFSRA